MKSLNVLIVEDNCSDAELITSLLVASSLDASIKHIEALYELKGAVEESKVDIILLDIHLPDSSGLHTVEEAVDRVGDIPIIVMANRADSILSRQVIKIGAQDYIIKGQLDEEMLTRAIKHSLERSTHLTALKSLNDSIAQHESELLAAQEIAQLGMWSLDIVSQEMKWSPLASQLLGFDEPPFRPRFSDFNQHIHPDDIDSLYDAVAKAQRSGESVMSEFRIVHQQGDIRYINSHVKLSLHDTSKGAVLTGVLQDVTERNMSQQLLIEKQLYSQINSAKNEILQDMGFMVRTPLSSTVNLLHILSKTSLDEEQQGLVNNLLASVDDVTTGVYNVLNLSLYSSSELEMQVEKVNMSDLLQSVKRALDTRFQNLNQQLLFTIDDEIPQTLETDPLKLNQLIFNLAELYAELGSKEEFIDLRVEMASHSEVKASGIFRIIATSRGVKMTKDEFEQYKSASFSNQITLNRTILNTTNLVKLTQAFDGYLQINSRPRKGTTLTIEVPVDLITEKKILQSLEPNTELSILLVEDHFLNQIATKGLLEKWSEFVSVDVASNGKEGVKKALDNKYNIVLMDLQMPVLDGWGATQEILQQKSDQVIIALSAHSNPEDEKRSEELGMAAFIVKPFKPIELFTSIMNSVIEYRES